MGIILSCEKLERVYAGGETEVRALDGITLSLAEGSFTAVTGASGSGKSTLLHVLSGLERPTGGCVMYKEKALASYTDDQLSILRRRRFGFVFQAYNLVQELTGLENILLPVMLDGRRADKAYIDRLVDALELRSRLHHLPSAMSGGQQQRFAIARALANKPSILFADEPTGNLDRKNGQEVITLLRELSVELKVTLLLVTHDPSIAEQAQRIIRLEDGHIAADSMEGALQ